MNNERKIYYDILQGSQEWIDIRIGKITGSIVKRIMGGRGGDKTLMNELIAEKIAGEPKQHYMNPCMERGLELEPRAISNYELDTGYDVTRVGCIELFGLYCSPDGLVGDDGIIEIKCPDSHNFIKWALDEKIPTEHRHQVVFNLWISGRDWLDFIVFDPRLKGFEMQVKRVYKKDLETEIKEMSEKVLGFKKDLEKCENSFKMNFKQFLNYEK